MTPSPMATVCSRFAPRRRAIGLLGLKAQEAVAESDLEAALLDNLPDDLLGKCCASPRAAILPRSCIIRAYVASASHHPKEET